MKNLKQMLLIGAILFATILIPLSTALVIYSHNHVVAAAVCGNQEARQIKGNPLKEILFTIKDLNK